GRRSLAVALIDDDGSAASQAFGVRLRQSDALRVEGIAQDEAERRVRRGELVAYVRLAPGFGAPSTGFPPRLQGLEVCLDPERKAERGLLGGVLAEAFYAPLRERFRGETPREREGPRFVDVTRREAAPSSAFEITFPSAVLWAMLGCVSTFAI